MLIIPKAISSSSLYLQHYAYIVALILLTRIIIGPYSCYSKKGLIYVTIIAPSSYQPSSYSKCTKSNICSYYDIYSVSNSKYIYTITLNSLLVPLLIATRVLGLIYC